MARGAAAPAGLPRPDGHAMLRALLEGMAVQVQRQSPAGLETGSARGGSHAGFIATGPVRRSPRPRRCCCLRVFPKKKPAGRRRVSTTISCGTPGIASCWSKRWRRRRRRRRTPDSGRLVRDVRLAERAGSRRASRRLAAAGKGRRAQLKSQQAPCGQIARLDPNDLPAQCPLTPEHFPLRYAIVHGLHGKACHSGEIWLLHSCCG